MDDGHGTVVEVELERLLVPGALRFEGGDGPPRLEWVERIAPDLIRVDWELDGRPPSNQAHSGHDLHRLRPEGLYHLSWDSADSGDPRPDGAYPEPGVLEVPRRARVGEVVPLGENPRQAPLHRGRLVVLLPTTWRGRPCLVVRSTLGQGSGWCEERWWVEGVGLVRTLHGELVGDLATSELRPRWEVAAVEVNGVDLRTGAAGPMPTRGGRLLQWHNLDDYARLWDDSEPGWVLLDSGAAPGGRRLEPFNEGSQTIYSCSTDASGPGNPLHALLVERMLAAGVRVVPREEEDRLVRGWNAVFDALERAPTATPACPVCGRRVLATVVPAPRLGFYQPFRRLRCEACRTERDDNRRHRRPSLE